MRVDQAEWRALEDLRIGAMCWEQHKRDTSGEHGPGRLELNLILVEELMFS